MKQPDTVPTSVSGPLPGNLLDLVVGAPAVDDRQRQIAGLSAIVVRGLYRLLRLLRRRPADHPLVGELLDALLPRVRRLAALLDGPVVVSRAQGTVFVDYELLTAPQHVHEIAVELGKMLARCRVAEISFDRLVVADDFRALGKAFALAFAEGGRRQAVLEASVPHIQVGAVDPDVADPEALELSVQSEAPFTERMLSLFVCAHVVVRTQLAEITAGRAPSPSVLKRIAQRLVGLLEGGDAVLPTLAILARDHGDDAGRALLCAMLAVAAGRTVTADRPTLRHLAHAALMADVGRVRLGGFEMRDSVIDRRSPLEPDVLRRVPATTAAICMAGGGLGPGSAVRTITAYETASLEQERALGPLYGGVLGASMPAHVMCAVRALLDQLAPRPPERPRCPAQALASVLRLPSTEPLTGRMLVAALGVLPVGTFVELDSGEQGMVTGLSAYPVAARQPRLRLVTDERGRPASRAREIDLGAPESRVAGRRVIYLLDPKWERANRRGGAATESS